MKDRENGGNMSFIYSGNCGGTYREFCDPQVSYMGFEGKYDRGDALTASI